MFINDQIMKMKITYLILSLFILSAVSVHEACSQSWLQDIGHGVKQRAKDRARQRVEDKIYQKVDKAVDKAFESTEEAVDKAIDSAVSSAEKRVRSAADTPPAPRKDNSALMAKFEGRAPGGKAFYPMKKGIVMTYASGNGKGKADSYTRTEITSLDWKDERNFSVITETTILDSDMNPVGTEPMTAGATVENGIVRYDPESMAGQLTEGMQVSGDNFYMPDNIEVGDILPDYTVIVSIGGMNTTSQNINIKVTGQETLNVSGNDIDCYIVESTVAVTALGFKSEMAQKVWYGRGVGQVRTESYNKKGKLMSVNELVELSGY